MKKHVKTLIANIAKHDSYTIAIKQTKPYKVWLNRCIFAGQTINNKCVLSGASKNDFLCDMVSQSRQSFFKGLYGLSSYTPKYSEKNYDDKPIVLHKKNIIIQNQNSLETSESIKSVKDKTNHQTLEMKHPNNCGKLG